jgi:AcrR family transcriptional regulator
MIPEIIASDSGWPYSKAKTAVLLAAVAVIREEGPRAATLKNIAGRAGITEPAIFRHFDGVDGLFGGLFTAFERIFERFNRAYESEENGLARLRGAMRGIVDILAESGDFAYTVLHAELIFRGYPELREHVTELRQRNEHKALECITKGAAAGDIRSEIDPESILASSFGLLYYTAVTWIESGFAFDLREVFEARWEDVERFISTRPVPRSAKRTSRLRSAALKVEALAPAKESARAQKSAKAQAAAKNERSAKKVPTTKVAVKTVKAKTAAKPVVQAKKK